MKAFSYSIIVGLLLVSSPALCSGFNLLPEEGEFASDQLGIPELWFGSPKASVPPALAEEKPRKRKKTKAKSIKPHTIWSDREVEALCIALESFSARGDIAFMKDIYSDVSRQLSTDFGRNISKNSIQQQIGRIIGLKTLAHYKWKTRLKTVMDSLGYKSKKRKLSTRAESVDERKSHPPAKRPRNE